MQQQADGWQEPEVAFFGIDFGTGWREEPGADAVQLPWLESSMGFRDCRVGQGFVEDAWQAPQDLRHQEQDQHSTGWNPAETLPSLLHDTRNMVAAMDLYCDLLEEPGVLAAPFRHYARELRLVATASRRLLEKLAALEGGNEQQCPPESNSILEFDRLAHASPRQSEIGTSETRTIDRHRPSLPVHLHTLPGSLPVASLAEDLLANQSLLSTLAGPAVTVGLNLSGGHRPIAMSSDDLTRVLVNLTRNAAEAMPDGGHIQISLEEFSDHLLLTFADNGPGIPRSALKAIFCPGYTTHVNLDLERDTGEGSHFGSGSTPHRGLGLSIVHSIVSSAGGLARAENQAGNRSGPETDIEEESGGASFVLQFPWNHP